MQFQSIVAVLSLALVATAIPTGPSPSPSTVVSGNQVCESNQTAAVCKPNSTTNTDGLIVVSLLSNLLSGNVLNCIGMCQYAALCYY